MSKKIFFIINSIDGGGAEKVFCKLVNDLDVDAEKVIISLDKNPPKYKINENVLFLSRYKLISALLLFLLFYKSRPIISVSFLPRSNFLNVLFSKIFEVKCVISERSNTSARLRGKFIRIKSKVLSFVYNRADKIVSCSKGVEECLRKQFSVSNPVMSVIYNPYDVAKLSNYTKSRIFDSDDYFCLVGRLVKTKRIINAIEAIVGTNLKIKILGDGPLKFELIEIVKKLKLEDQVQFLGFIEDPHQVVKDSIGFILTSECEGFPNAVLEAMLLRVPCILSNCKDGPAELLEYYDEIAVNDYKITSYGLMFNVGDVIALQKAMLKIKCDKQFSEIISSNAFEKCAKYTDENFLLNFKGFIHG